MSERMHLKASPEKTFLLTLEAQVGNDSLRGFDGHGVGRLLVELPGIGLAAGQPLHPSGRRVEQGGLALAAACAQRIGHSGATCCRGASI